MGLDAGAPSRERCAAGEGAGPARGAVSDDPVSGVRALAPALPVGLAAGRDDGDGRTPDRRTAITCTASPVSRMVRCHTASPIRTVRLTGRPTGRWMASGVRPCRTPATKTSAPGGSDRITSVTRGPRAGWIWRLLGDAARGVGAECGEGRVRGSGCARGVGRLPGVPPGADARELIAGDGVVTVVAATSDGAAGRAVAAALASGRGAGVGDAGDAGADASVGVMGDGARNHPSRYGASSRPPARPATHPPTTATAVTGSRVRRAGPGRPPSGCGWPVRPAAGRRPASSRARADAAVACRSAACPALA